MAPFPESEDMTIKRIMVALRKNDYQLLKMGTYKLHEKFHTGHEFELIDDLRQILETVEQKQYPPEISDILCSTIKDILSKKAMKQISWENQILPSDSGKNDTPEVLQPVNIQEYHLKNNQENDIKELAQAINSSRQEQSSLPEINKINLNTSINENTNQLSIQPQTQAYNNTQANQTSTQNAYYRPAQPASPLNAIQPANRGINQAENIQAQGINQSGIQNAGTQNPPAQNIQQAQNTYIQNVPQNAAQNLPSQGRNETSTARENNGVKNIAVFYDDFKNDIDFSRVKDYKNNLNLLFSKNASGQDYNILQQISSLTQLLDTDVSGIDKIISMLSTSKGKVSFVTASQSQHISRIFCEKNIDFDIPFVKKAKDKNTAFDLIPMVGATNIFVCSNCNLRTLKTDFNTRTLSVQCPHCDGAAFPDIYAVNSYNPDCNPVFWHRALAALIKSQIWILVNPPLDENKEVIFDFIKTAYETSTPSKIYILSRENDKKEFYRQMFMSINEDCEIKLNFSDQDKLCEEFINEEIIKKVFA